LPARPHLQSPSPPPQAANGTTKETSAKDAEAPTRDERDYGDEARTEPELTDAKEEAHDEDEQEKGKEKEKKAEEAELSEDERARAVRVTGLPPFMATADIAHFFVFCGRIERLSHERYDASPSPPHLHTLHANAHLTFSLRVCVCVCVCMCVCVCAGRRAVRLCSTPPRARS
jgi:hypothetical protein